MFNEKEIERIDNLIGKQCKVIGQIHGKVEGINFL